jgi:glycosyltransferase involved in cell wall biosynthesis
MKMTSKKRILVLTTYPLKNPQHGGQKRTHAIVNAYKSNHFTVRHCAVFYKGFYVDYGKDDVPLGVASEQLIRQSPLTGDIVCGEAIYKDPKVKRKIIKLLKTFQPQIIHIEQPFPYLGLKPLLKDLNLTPKLIFGSQNIEAPMKREILEGAHVPEPNIVEAVKIIEDIETSLTIDSELVAACTAEDLNAHAELKARKLVLAPNGISEIKTNKQSLQHWQKAFNSAGVTRKVLFVGSAHPPNWTGFLDMVGKGLGFIPHDTRLVLAGSICDYFEREISDEAPDIEDATFWLRAYSAGRLSEPRLGALIKQCDVMLLPITEGGGSNLKTAEAILANKKVVTTSHALRSFEWFKDFPNVWVADTKRAFQGSITAALKTPFVARTPEQEEQIQKVTWESCLSDLVKEVSAL